MKIKPCPFCGSEIIIDYFSSTEYFPRCSKTGCVFGRFRNGNACYPTEEEAIKAVNTRAE